MSAYSGEALVNVGSVQIPVVIINCGRVIGNFHGRLGRLTHHVGLVGIHTDNEQRHKKSYHGNYKTENKPLCKSVAFDCGCRLSLSIQAHLGHRRRGNRCSAFGAKVCVIGQDVTAFVAI